MILSSQPLNVNLNAAHKARTCALAFTLHILESSNFAREEASETHDLCKHCSFDPQNFIISDLFQTPKSTSEKDCSDESKSSVPLKNEPNPIRKVQFACEHKLENKKSEVECCRIS